MAIRSICNSIFRTSPSVRTWWLKKFGALLNDAVVRGYERALNSIRSDQDQLCARRCLLVSCWNWWLSWDCPCLYWRTMRNTFLSTWTGGIHSRGWRVLWTYESVYDWIARKSVVSTLLWLIQGASDYLPTVDRLSNEAKGFTLDSRLINGSNRVIISERKLASTKMSR